MKNILSFEKFEKACWKGYKQIGMKIHNIKMKKEERISGIEWVLKIQLKLMIHLVHYTGIKGLKLGKINLIQPKSF